MRVLLIDDHALVRKGIEELLQSRGVQVVASVGSGEEGVRRDGSAYRSLRDYAEAGLTKLFPLAARSWLDVGRGMEVGYQRAVGLFNHWSLPGLCAAAPS